jgi:tRNA modification GTPase
VNPKSPEDTIAAIATPPGEGGIGIVRISGSRAVPIAGRLFHSAGGRRLTDASRRVFYGEIRDNGTVLDEALVHVMRAPHSYTREDVVEINCHGGAALLHAVLEAVVRGGARLAGPGEFTRRAFVNGRIDLVQAEAVIDRIQAQGRAALVAASSAARGTLSREIHAIRDALVTARSHIEAAIDFPDQDVPESAGPEVGETLRAACKKMERLLETADAGRLLREGATIGIAGRPNVGKSSLFNALVRESRAIVTRHAGTTRDVLQETIAVDGIPVRLCDMAGIRESADEVERLGVDSARRVLAESALILFVVDATEGVVAGDRALAEELARIDARAVVVTNKIDLSPGPADAPSLPGLDALAFCRVSALTGAGLAELERTMAGLLKGGFSWAPDQALLTRLHQKDSVRRALEAVRRVDQNLDAAPEIAGIDLGEALDAIGEVTGETTPDEILERVFSSFCIGK